MINTISERCEDCIMYYTPYYIDDNVEIKVKNE